MLFHTAKWHVKFAPRDLWVGVYLWFFGNWPHKNRHLYGRTRYIKIHVCLIPCFPIIFTWFNQAAWTRHLIDVKRRKERL